MKAFGPRFLAAGAAVALALAGPAHSAGVPFTDKSVSIAARGQDVRDFVADLFAQAGLRAKITSSAKGKVQGVFVGRPSDIWGTVSRAYGLIAYYDGTIVRIYTNDEVTSRTIAATRPDQIVGEANRMKLIDSVNTVRASKNLVLATGVPAFLERIEDMSGRMSMPAPVITAAAPPVQPAVLTTGITPMGGATNVASPLTLRPLTRLPIRSEVIMPAGIRSPFEVRMFHLRYRDAADKEVRSSDRTSVVPGVATLLLEQMGDGRGVGAVSTSGSNVYASSGLNRLGGERRRGGNGFYGDEPSGSAEGPAAPAAASGDGPRISADQSNNAVIVRDIPERMHVYEKLIAALDTEPVMIETQVTIIEVNTNRMRELGADFNLGIGGLRLAFGGDVARPGGATAANAAGGYLSGNGDFFNVRIRALEQAGALRVVTRPVLSAPSNQVAVFDNTTAQVIKLQGEREVDAFTVNYGLAMRIKPSAIEDGGELRIRMQIEISDTQLNGLVVDGVPTASGPRISTQTIVKQGESVMIAGMTQNREYDYKSKTPLLGDIPIVGQAFRKRDKGQNHYEKLFLLTPRIISLGNTNYVEAHAQPAPLSLEQISGKGRKVRRP